MMNEFTQTTKQTAMELISKSEEHAADMHTWADVLDNNPESITAKLSAGFVTKPDAASGIELVIDVQAPPEDPAVVRTWAIRTTKGDDQKEYFDNIQLTYETDAQQAQELIAKGKDITRDDIRTLLQSDVSKLAAIAVSNGSGGDGMGHTYGERYDYSAAELAEQPDTAATLTQVLHTVLPRL